MRRQIISSRLPGIEVYEIVGHDNLVYLKIAGLYFLGLIAAYGAYRVLSQYLTDVPRQIIFGILGALIYLKAMYDIADEYLDALVITNLGLVMFRRNGLFSYKTDSLQWIAIESVSEEQNSIRDRLLKKGDLVIRSEEERYIFQEAQNPTKHIANIIKRKQKILGREHYSAENEKAEDNYDKYELLVEALGEVVTEYVDKKQQH